MSKLKNFNGSLWNEIYILRNEIVDIVLQGAARNRIPVRELKHKAMLIKKYSRRLRVLSI